MYPLPYPVKYSTVTLEINLEIILTFSFSPVSSYTGFPNKIMQIFRGLFNLICVACLFYYFYFKWRKTGMECQIKAV